MALRDVDAGLAARIALDTARRFELPAPPDLRAAWQMVNLYSVVQCLAYAQGNWQQRVFVKLARGPDTPRDDLLRLLQREFDMLRGLAGHDVASARAGAVEALALYPDLPALVTVEASGPTLRHVYARSARQWSRPATRRPLIDLAARCGQWLAAFQARGAGRVGPFPVDEFIGYCDVRLALLRERHPAILTAAQSGAIRDAARRAADQLPASGVAQCASHNDFASHNIIVCNEGDLRVLDFMASGHGPAALDRCNFWFELEMLKCDPSYSTALLARMQRAFLDAQDLDHPVGADMQLARLRYTINRLLKELGEARAIDHWSPRWRRAVARTRGWLLDFASGAGTPRNTQDRSARREPGA